MKIKCPACDFENEEGTRFCNNCNEPLGTPKIPDTTKSPYTIINNKNINKKQRKNKFKLRNDKKNSRKIVLGIFVPVFMFFIFYAIAYYIGGDTVSIEGNGRFSRDMTRTYYYGQKTWPIWIIYLMSFCVFEYILFKDIFFNKMDLILKRIFKI